MIEYRVLILLLGLGFSCLQLSAQEGFAPDDFEEEEWEREHEEIPDPSQREILRFLSEYLPEAVPLLERVREEESFREYQEVLERAAEIYIDYHTALREGAREEAALILEMQRAELRLEQATLAWHESDSRQAREQSQRELAAAAAELIDVEIKFARSELTFLERETRQVRAELTRLETERDDLIDEIVREVTDE